MVAFSTIALSLSAVAGAFAAPTADAFEDIPDFELTSTNSLARRQDYNQNYKTSGTVNYSPTSNGYSVSFSNAGDFVVGKGWKTGTTRFVWPRSRKACQLQLTTLTVILTSAVPPRPRLVQYSYLCTVGPRTLSLSTTSRNIPVMALGPPKAPKLVLLPAMALSTIFGSTPKSTSLRSLAPPHSLSTSATGKTSDLVVERLPRSVTLMLGLSSA